MALALSDLWPTPAYASQWPRNGRNGDDLIGRSCVQCLSNNRTHVPDLYKGLVVKWHRVFLFGASRFSVYVMRWGVGPVTYPGPDHFTAEKIGVVLSLFILCERFNRAWHMASLNTLSH